jgi:hypothetical protein
MPAFVNLQHVNVKLFLKSNGSADLDSLIPVFHGWIQDRVCEELLLDVADYRHVPAGPGVVLIGLQADYGVDNNDDRLGLRYNRKAALDGTNQDRLRQATRAALTACQRLEADQRLEGKLQFNGQEIEIFINDRLLAPNTDATREAASPDLQSLAQKLFGGSEYSLSYNTDPRRLFTAFVKASRPFPVADLLRNLNS